jgi:hypothetical protein
VPGFHVFAQIAPRPTASVTVNGLRKLSKPAPGAPPPYSSDYSFLFVTETKR